MSAPTVANSAASTYAAATSISVALPPSLTIGQLLMIFVSTRGTSNTFTLSGDPDPRGWAQLVNAAAQNCEIFWKICNGTEPTPGNLLTISYANSAAAVAFAISVNGTSPYPIDASNVLANSASTNILAPAVVAKRDTDLLVCFFEANVATAITVPGSMTSVSGSTTGNARSVNAAWEVLTASGTTGTRTATVGSSVANNGASVVIREANANGISMLIPYNRTNYPNAEIGVGLGENIAVDLGSGLGHYWGSYKISGHTRQAGTLDPLYRRVMLMDKYGQKVIRGQMSVNADGSYTFTNLPAGEYIVLGVDQNGVQNAVVCARITAVAM